ncbi:hypothetical protein DER71_11640 [Halanaerobium sp. DL-01]|uniref:hypothetical protein n=1 Tax=Halanaerobium sp. DL-01 TaxID=1653064 RepID=UPI000DF1FA00|nr:hypothetical protein [Halanaerobium sp. DL-01]RCW83507.1 hypothetical protein DER71_11640 [Halanaerobium sp. DL-01]
MKGKCKICGNEYTQSGMSRHLKSCLNKNYDKIVAEEQAQKTLYYHIYIKGTYRSEYWLQLQVKADAKLSDLDKFLRDRSYSLLANLVGLPRENSRRF